MAHNIEGDIRNCIEVANYDYSLSHLDEPMLNYYNELVAKARAFDKVLKIDDQATDGDRITGEYESDIETVLSEYKERADDER